MPFVAIAAVAAGAAVATGVAAVSTIAMAGLATSVVGKITKSKELMQIGAGMGLGASVAGIAQSVFGAAEGVSSAAGSVASDSAAASAGAAEGASGVSQAAGTLDGASNLGTAADTASAASQSTGLTSGLDGAASTASQSQGLLTPSNAALTATPQSSVPLSATPQASMAPGTSGYLGNAASGAASSITQQITPPSTFEKISTWFAKQPESTKNVILQAGLGGASKLFDGWSAEQKAALERERFNLEQTKYNTAMANGSAQPTIKFQQVPQGRGLLTPTGA